MSDLFIDISAGSCVAKCPHCKHGTAEAIDSISYPASLIDTYQRLINYADATRTKVRVSFMDNALRLPSLFFLGDVHTLSLAFDTLTELSDSTDRIIDICKKIASLSILELHVHKQEVPDTEVEEILNKLITLQMTLLQHFPDVLIAVGINNNTTSELLYKTEIRLLPMFILYQEMVHRAFGPLLNETRIEILRRTPLLYLNCEVSFTDRKAMSFGARYIDATITPDETHRWGYSLHINEAPLVVALFPWGVHLDHSTININDNRLKFSHRDFEKLLVQATCPGMSLKQVCFEAVQGKRNVVRTIRV